MDYKEITNVKKYDPNTDVAGYAHVPIGQKVEQVTNGGEGSGNFGHEGRPGEVGGSGEGGGSSLSSLKEKAISRTITKSDITPELKELYIKSTGLTGIQTIPGREGYYGKDERGLTIHLSDDNIPVFLQSKIENGSLSELDGKPILFSKWFWAENKGGILGDIQQKSGTFKGLNEKLIRTNYMKIAESAKALQIKGDYHPNAELIWVPKSQVIL